MKEIRWMAILACMFVGNCGLAQEQVLSFDKIKDEISAGDSVRVTDNSGNVIKGKVIDVSSTSLLLTDRKFSIPTNSIRILQKKRKDPWWNGFLIGGGAGAIGGLLVAKAHCSNDSECDAYTMAAFVPAGLAIGMVTGALIDRSVTKYDTLFTNNKVTSERKFQVSPIVSRKQRAINLSLAF